MSFGGTFPKKCEKIIFPLFLKMSITVENLMILMKNQWILIYTSYLEANAAPLEYDIENLIFCRDFFQPTLLSCFHNVFWGYIFEKMWKNYFPRFFENVHFCGKYDDFDDKSMDFDIHLIFGSERRAPRIRYWKFNFLPRFCQTNIFELLS